MNYNETEQTNGGSENRTGVLNYIGDLELDDKNKVIANSPHITGTMRLSDNPYRDEKEMIGENPVELKLFEEKTVIKGEEPNK